MPNERAIQLDPLDPSATGQPEPTGTYPVQATCSNCDWVGEAQMFKGVPWERGKTTDRVACPECSCKTLVRNHHKPQPPVTQPIVVPYVRALEENRQLEEFSRRQEEMQQQQEAARRERYLPNPSIGQPQRPHWHLLQDPVIDHTVRPSTTDGTQGDGMRTNQSTAGQPDASFLERLGLPARAAQQITEYAATPEGAAVITNAARSLDAATAAVRNGTKSSDAALMDVMRQLGQR